MLNSSILVQDVVAFEFIDVAGQFMDRSRRQTAQALRTIRRTAGSRSRAFKVNSAANVWQWRSSAKHAAIAPRYLGLRAVIAKSFTRIHWQNLANYGVLALEFENPGDYDTIDQGDTLGIQQLRDALANKDTLQVDNLTKESTFTVHQRLSSRQAQDVLAGGLIARLAQEEN
jgi:3-isopropylmalate dehydratase small subunit